MNVCWHWQEVDYEHYTTRLRVSMKQLGYEGVLLQRQDDLNLATFWHSSMFELMTERHVVLHELVETHLQVITVSSFSYKTCNTECRWLNTQTAVSSSYISRRSMTRRRRKNPGQISHTCVPLSPSSISHQSSDINVEACGCESLYHTVITLFSVWSVMIDE